MHWKTSIRENEEMREQLSDVRIAIMGTKEPKAELANPQITWFGDASKIDAEDFDFAIDMDLEEAISVTFEGSKSVIHASPENKASLLQSIIDILTSEQYMDLDPADVMDMWGTDCNFKSISAKNDDAESYATEWLHNKEINSALLIYFQGGFLQGSVNETIEKIESMLKPDVELACAFSYNKEDTAKISLWYR
jgi:hypothetical protein